MVLNAENAPAAPESVKMIEIYGSQWYLRTRKASTEKKKTNLGKLGLIISVLGIIVAFVPVILATFSIGHFRENMSIWMGFGLVTFLLIAGILVPRFARLVDSYSNFIRGLQAQDTLIAILEKSLHGQWLLFRDLKLPVKDGGIDLVLLGPRGIYA